MNPCFFDSVPEPPVPPKSGVGWTPVSIRTLRAQDLSELADILTESFHPGDGIARWMRPFWRLGIYEDMRHRLRTPSPHYVCLVAGQGWQERDRLVGIVEMTLRASPIWCVPTHQYPYISNLAVRSEFRRQGVARQLLATCEEIAGEWGFSNLYLHVLENNHQARQLYGKLGYTSLQVEETWESWLMGRSRRLFLRKHLAASRSA
ncbi:GNAT family N-acetyltransferase [Zarconia navalis]|nr:GNAT family N-acetyltransferase [Zarconia navalis]